MQRPGNQSGRTRACTRFAPRAVRILAMSGTKATLSRPGDSRSIRHQRQLPQTLPPRSDAQPGAPRARSFLRPPIMGVAEAAASGGMPGVRPLSSTRFGKRTRIGVRGFCRMDNISSTPLLSAAGMRRLFMHGASNGAGPAQPRFRPIAFPFPPRPQSWFSSGRSRRRAHAQTKLAVKKAQRVCSRRWAESRMR